jgi:hypothetical protein
MNEEDKNKLDEKIIEEEYSNRDGCAIISLVAFLIVISIMVAGVLFIFT